jgi:hypothetical protein
VGVASSKQLHPTLLLSYAAFLDAAINSPYFPESLLRSELGDCLIHSTRADGMAYSFG